MCNVQRACWDLLLGSFVPSVLCNPCPVCAVCYVTGWPLIPRPDAVYTIITHMRSARVLHGIMAYVAKRSKAVVVNFVLSLYIQYVQKSKANPVSFSFIFSRKRERGKLECLEAWLPRCNPDCSAGGWPTAGVRATAVGRATAGFHANTRGKLSSGYQDTPDWCPMSLVYILCPIWP